MGTRNWSAGYLLVMRTAFDNRTMWEDSYHPNHCFQGDFHGATKETNLNPINSQPQHSHLRFHSYGDAVALFNPVIPRIPCSEPPKNQLMESLRCDSHY